MNKKYTFESSLESRNIPLWDDLTLRKYLGEIKRRCGIVDTLALPNMRDLPPIRIESLFVQPLLSDVPVNPSSNPETWPEGELLLEALNEKHRVVLLGDPGSGKTTLANWLAWRLSSGLIAPLPKILENKLPIPCTLREMADEIFNENIGISDLALNIAHRLLGPGISDKLIKNIEKRVIANEYVLILDGVDEIPVIYRKQVAFWMQSAFDSDACVLATTRIVGYEDLPFHQQNSLLPEHIPLKIVNESMIDIANEKYISRIFDSPMSAKSHTDTKELLSTWRGENLVTSVWATLKYLMPFDKKRIAMFVENWYLQRTVSETEGKKRADDLIFSLEQSSVTAELARTPNLLSLMAIVHRERAHLPDGRALLYREIANAYINTIDQHRKIQADDALAPYGWEARETWLAYVGFMMQLQRGENLRGSAEGVITTEEKVLEWLRFSMNLSGVSEAQLSAKEFLKWVARRSGLLLPRGEGRYSFVHLSFQEYFCARFVAGKIISPTFLNNEDNPFSPVKRSDLSEWSKSSVWRESLICLFELVSAERDRDWSEYLISLIFDRNIPKFSNNSKAALAGNILTNRHINISKFAKDAVALSCSEAAVEQIRYGITVDKQPIFQALVANNYVEFYSDRAGAIQYNVKAKSLEHFNDRIKEDILIIFAESHHFSALPDIRELENLRLLDLEGFKVENSTIFDKMASLLTLRISSCPNLEISLSGLKSLRDLTIRRSGLRKIPSLRGLKDLKFLSFSYNPIKSLIPLKGIRTALTLYLDSTNISDISPLSNLTELRVLSIDNNKVSDISPLINFNRIFILYADNNPIVDFSPIATLTELSTLSLNDTSLSDGSIFENLKKLTKLRLNNTHIADFSFLRCLNNLTELDLSYTSFSDLSLLSHLTELTYLDLDHTNISDLRPLTSLKNLSRLKIRGTQSTEKDLSVLEKFTTIAVTR